MLIVRLGFILGTLLLAVCVPHFDLLMGLTGSLTGSALSFIFPCIFHISIKRLKLRYHEGKRTKSCRTSPPTVRRSSLNCKRRNKLFQRFYYIGTISLILILHYFGINRLFQLDIQYSLTWQSSCSESSSPWRDSTTRSRYWCNSIWTMIWTGIWAQRSPLRKNRSWAFLI